MMEELFREHLPLVHSLVRRYRSDYTEVDDLVQVGCIGLWKALTNFDASRGTAFTTYAVPVIAGEIKMYLRGQGAVKYSRSLQAQAIRLRRLKEELEQRLGRRPTLGELSEVSGLERGELVAALDVQSAPLSLDAGRLEEKELLPEVVVEAEAVIDRVALWEVIASLPERERKIIIYRFFRGRTQQEVAGMLGLSQVHVSRLERKILGELKKRLVW